MKKIGDWIPRFQAVIEEAENKNFNWITHNCCTFSSECIKAITGVDTLKDIPGDPKTRRGVLAKLQRFSKTGIMGAGNKLAAEHGLQKVVGSIAQRGDPCVAVNANGEELMGVVDLSGRNVLAISPENGLVRLPISTITRAWRIN